MDFQLSLAVQLTPYEQNAPGPLTEGAAIADSELALNRPETLGSDKGESAACFLASGRAARYTCIEVES